MTDATLTLPDCELLWDIEDQVLAAQRVAYRLFESRNWIWAYKALARVERLARRMAHGDNPFVQAGDAILNPTGRPAFRSSAPRSSARPSAGPAPAPDPPAPSPEALHASLTERLRVINAMLAEEGLEAATLRDMVDVHADTLGDDLIAAILAVEARAVETRIGPAPSG